MTRVVAVDPDRPDPAILLEAAAILRSGGLVAFGTETVYGLGADATNPAAVARIFEAKGRPATNPLIVHVVDAESAQGCVIDWPDAADRLAKRFWPGPLTLVLPRSRIIPDLVTTGRDTVGVRVPASPIACELIRLAGVPIAAPSANRSNRISPTTAAHVVKDLDGVVDLILDTGPCLVGIESTVLDLSGEHPTILRPGAVTAGEIAATIGRPVAHFGGSVGPDRAATSPGQLAIHYAPRTPAYRITWTEWESLKGFDPDPPRFGMLFLGEPPGGYPPLGAAARLITKPLTEPDRAAARLYEMLHLFDEQGLDFLLIVTPPDDEPGWLAVLDRVRRATRPWQPVVLSGGSNPPDQRTSPR